MKNKFMLAVFLVAVLLALTVPVKAQFTAGQIVSINAPISSELRAALDAWLVTPPAAVPYYAVTYTQQDNNGIYVSMVGLNIENPDDEWSIVGDEFGNQQVVWMDTLLVAPDGSITLPFAEPTSSASAFKLAAPIYAPSVGPGGGNYVRFPWQPSKAVQFGILGAHDAEFGLSGGVAVDFVSGDDMGSAAANDFVYASVTGSVSHICDYGDTVAVRLSGDGDQFLYAHLLPNENLELNYTFSAGSKMGRLKHGTFTDECGNAFQKENHWHLHWGFLMSGGKFRAEGCTMTGAGPLAKWQCGDKTVKVLGFLYHYGNISANPGDPGTIGDHTGIGGAGGGPSFWDYFLEGVTGIFSALFIKSLPEHNTNLNSLFNGVLTSVKVVMRVAYMLIRGNLNLLPTLAFVGIGLVFAGVIRLINVVLFVLRFIKQIPGII
jgi:hypothetical protein